MNKKRPWMYIEPFTGEAARWLTRYMRETQVDPAAQARIVDAAIRAGAAKSVKGKPADLARLRKPRTAPPGTPNA